MVSHLDLPFAHCLPPTKIIIASFCVSLRLCLAHLSKSKIDGLSPGLVYKFLLDGEEIKAPIFSHLLILRCTCHYHRHVDVV
jgi:hypothetical protein